jgi:hypothetical protein
MHAERLPLALIPAPSIATFLQLEFGTWSYSDLELLDWGTVELFIRQTSAVADPARDTAICEWTFLV